MNVAKQPLITLLFLSLVSPVLVAQDSFVPQSRPGVGEFYSSEIQEQLNSVRQSSVRPLELEFPSREKSSPDIAEEVAEKEIIGQKPEKIIEEKPKVVEQQAKENIAPNITQNIIKNITKSVAKSLLDLPKDEDTVSDLRQPEEGEIPVVKQEMVSVAKAIPSDKKPSRQINTSKTIPMGEPFQLSLHGLIWTYIPGLSEYPADLKFERKLGNLETSFNFSLPEQGRYLLVFSRQYPSTGALEYYSAEIIVEGSENVPLQSVALQEVALTEQSSVPKTKVENIENIDYRINSQVISDVRELLQKGELESAYQTLNNWPESEKGDIYDSAAKAFLDANMNSEAADMWQRNLSLEGKLRDNARYGIVRASIQGKDTDRLLEWLPEFVDLAKRGPTEGQEPLVNTEDFVEIHQALKDTGAEMNGSSKSKNAGTVLSFYQTYVELYPDSNRPEILYSMANYYESPGEMQNLRHARQLYMDIQSKYPVARYSQLAQERINYLNRQFFYVR